LHKVLYLEF